jgi:hypothetical protein
VVNIEDQFLTFRAGEIRGFERILTLSQRHSFVPQGFDPLFFANLPEGHELLELRRSLDREPDERPLLQGEHDLWFRKLRESAAAATRRMAAAAAGAVPVTVPDAGHGAPVPHYEIKRGHVSFAEEPTRLDDLVDEVGSYFGARCRVQGDFYYPVGGFRTWHTNRYDSPGWRMYIVDVDVPARSFFRLRAPATGTIHTQWDEPGTVNFFLIDPAKIMWHCIGSDTNRWSKGFLVPETWHRQILG